MTQHAWLQTLPLFYQSPLLYLCTPMQDVMVAELNLHICNPSPLGLFYHKHNHNFNLSLLIVMVL